MTMKSRRSNPVSGPVDQMDLFGAPAPDERLDPTPGFDAVGAISEEGPVVECAVAEALMEQLSGWARQGALRWLDLNLVRFVQSLAPDTDPAVLLAVALLGHLEGRGHTCLSLGELLPLEGPDDASRRAAALGWPEPVQAELEAVWCALRQAEGANLGWTGRMASCRAVDGTAPAKGAAPLVWISKGERLYLRRHWTDEQRVALSVRQRVEPSDGAVASEGPAADDALIPQIRAGLDRLFGPPGDGQGGVDWQRVACALAMRSRLTLITGGPGTGKTYTVARLLALMAATHASGASLRIALAAPTGKAAARLRQSLEAALVPLQTRLGADVDLTALIERIGPARTLHALLGARPDTRRFSRNASHPLDVDLLVVDEASMVHLEMMAALLDALPADARLVLLGDKDQLASVEAGAVLGDLCRRAEEGRYDASTADWVIRTAGEVLPDAMRVPAAKNAPTLAQQTVMLRRSRRFDGAIGRLAQAVNLGDAAGAWRELRSGDPAVAVLDGSTSGLRGDIGADLVHLALHGRRAVSEGYGAYAKLVHAGPTLHPESLRANSAADSPETVHEHWVRSVLQRFDRIRLLSSVREGDWGVSGLNRSIEAALDQSGLLSPRGEWYEGRPVMVTKNDPSLGVFNGDVGLTLRPPGGFQGQGGGGRGLRVYFLDGDQIRSVLASRLTQVETAYAMTVHKSQGSEFRHTLLVLPPLGRQGLTRELVYTGITRAREFLTLVVPEACVFDEAVRRRTLRSSGLPALIGLDP